jgi:hypothetical protein
METNDTNKDNLARFKNNGHSNELISAVQEFDVDAYQKQYGENWSVKTSFELFEDDGVLRQKSHLTFLPKD